MRALTVCWPNLVAAGVDPARFGAELSALNDAAMASDCTAGNLGREVQVAELDCEKALAGVAAWQKRVRAWMKIAPNTPEGARAVADVRQAISGRVLRFSASVRIARAGIAALEARTSALIETVKVVELVAEGRARLTALSDAVMAHGAAVDARKLAVRAARADDRAVRRKMRHLRLCWNIAVSESPASMFPFNLWIAKADVASRAWRNRARRRRARGLPVGHVVGVGAARIPPRSLEGAPPGAPAAGVAG